MTENDKKLIEWAESVGDVEWDQVLQAQEKADTEQAKEMLHDIGMSLYHRNEDRFDML